MKILFSTDQIYLHGGVERVLATKANYWSNYKNAEVFIITTEQKGNTNFFDINSEVKFFDLNINYNRNKSYFHHSNILKAIKHFFRQKKLIKSIKPDFIISPNYNFDHYWLNCIKGKAKSIKEIHNSQYSINELRKTANILQKIKLKLDDHILKLYDYIVVLNDDEKKYFSSNNVIVIPNPVEKSKFLANVASKQIISAGRIAPVKRFDLLIEAWNMIHEEFKDWQLHIYGENHLDTKKKLEKIIEHYQLQNSIQLRSPIKDIPKKMKDYSIFVLSSEMECFPTVLLESLSVGLPIVSFDCPNGPRNIFTDNKEGILVEHLNIEKLAFALKKLMSNEKLRQEMSQNALKKSYTFSLEQVMSQWDKILEK